MTLPPPYILGPLWGVSELCLTLTRRSKPDFTSKDRNSLRLIWLVIPASIGLGILLAFKLPAWGLPLRKQFYIVGFGLFVVGMFLRWFSIVYLGRFFTSNVAIAADHDLIDSGPYRWMRHPSYTGSLLTALGFSLCMENLVSLLVIFVPSFVVCLWRIRIEEQALVEAFGERYRTYMQRTKRLIPLVY